MKAENLVGREHVRRTQDGVAAGGMGHDQVRDFEIVAQPGIGFLGLSLGQPGENSTSERLDGLWHPALLPAMSSGS
jgi:hypothetical protein